MKHTDIENLIEGIKFDEVTNAIQSIKPNSEVTINVQGDIIWHDGNPTNITAQQIADKITELRVEYDALTYSRKRRREYPSIQEQLDMQYWDGVNSTTTWADAIAKVKSDNPK